MSNSKQFSYFWRSAAEGPVTTVMGDRTEEQREYSQTQRDQRHREASEQKAKNPFARRKRVTLAVCVQARRAGGGADGGAHFMFCLYLCNSCYMCVSVCVRTFVRDTFDSFSAPCTRSQLSNISNYFTSPAWR